MSVSRNFDGKWISNQEFAQMKPINVFHRSAIEFVPPENMPQNKHILFRKTFNLENFKKAEMYISADDYYKLYINGLPVTMGPCAGYPDRFYYNFVDVSDYLMPGENTIAVHTYYQGLINRVFISGDGRHGLLLDLVVDGKTVVKSDESFLCAEHTGYEIMGKAGYDTQFLIRYDSRVPETEFAIPYFDDSSWENAHIVKFNDRKMVPQPTKQIETLPIKPTEVRKKGNTVFIDFGSNYVGYLFLAAKGKCGDVVTIRCGQELDDEGNVRWQMRAVCKYKEEWILSGGDDTLDWFDYKAFRYAEVDLPEGATLETADIRLIARHYPFTLKATPNTKDPDLLKIWGLCVNSLHFGVQETIMDCMEREKGQYTGDGIYTSTTLALLTKDTSIMEKLIDDALHTKFIDGGLMSCTNCSLMQEISDYSLMLTWLLPIHYHLTGDKEFSKSRYQKMVNLVEYFRNHYETKEEGLLYDVDKWCVVDWPDRSRDGYAYNEQHKGISPGTHNVICAYYIGAVKTLNRIAEYTGNEKYRDTAKMEENFIKAFYNSDAGLFRDTLDSDHMCLPGNILPLLFDIIPDNRFQDNVLKMIDEKGLKPLNIFMTFPLLAAVKRVGADDLLLKLLKSSDGWLNMIKEGATTTFEAFGKDRKWNTSLFHLAFTFAVQYLTDWDIEKLLNGKDR